MRRIAGCLVLAAMVAACVGAAPPTPIIVYTAPPASAEATPDSTKEATPAPTFTAAPTPTVTPRATPTPRITPTPVPTPGVAELAPELAAACDGPPVPWAAPYAGTVHPVVVAGIDYRTDAHGDISSEVWTVWDNNYSYQPATIAATTRHAAMLRIS